MSEVKSNRAWRLECETLQQDVVRLLAERTHMRTELLQDIERLTAELAEKDNHVMLLQHEKGLGILASTEMCKKITALQDLAEHWAILAEQRRVELAEIRQQLKDNFGYATAEEEKP